MASNTDPTPPRAGRGGMSLYANLINPGAGTISSAPVVYSQITTSNTNQDETAANAAQKQINAAALRFQPTKRPQPAQQKVKSKPNFAKIPSSSGADAPLVESKAAPPTAPAFKSTIEDWAGDDDDAVEDYNASVKRDRMSRKKRKKQRHEEKMAAQNWDDIYDPSRPNNYEDYKNSEEKYREIREWKDRLYAHRLKNRRRSDDYSDESEVERPSMSRNFAPPPSYGFAPPTSYDDEAPPPPFETEYVPPPPPTHNIPDFATGDEAYARRMALSQNPNAVTAAPPQMALPPPPPPPEPTTQSTAPIPAPTPAISRAPVRYNLPDAPSSLPSTDAELEAALEPSGEAEDGQDAEPAARSLRPGQKGFAERLLSKYGWTKGSGLGASGTGIVNPLRVQVEKRKKRSDAEGGGFVGPAAKGKIIAGKMGKAKTGDDTADAGKEEEGPGALSEVVILKGMVDGLDIDAELAGGELMQEIGEECGEKYGRVERVFIYRHAAEGTSIPVFVKFTSQLSALRAVNALEGRTFNGNIISARFWDAEKFDMGVYE